MAETLGKFQCPSTAKYAGLYPAPGAVLAVDPDIPEARQRIALEAEGEGVLLLDGEPLKESLWKPVKGRHHLKLSSRDGQVIDAVSFEVR